MIRRVQHRIARSRIALPITIVYALTVWILAGTLTHGWWLQLACFSVSCYLTILLSNVHALIRVYSRMVSCAFIALNVAACFLFPSLHGTVIQTCILGCLLLLFSIYQDHTATGKTFYAFALLGIASMLHVQLLWASLLLWVLMATTLMALSWKTWAASLLGILLPYWFYGCWLLYQGDLTPFVAHFATLVPDIQTLQQEIFDYTLLSRQQVLCLCLTIVSSFIGAIHFYIRKSRDKIRTRLYFYFLIWIELVATVYLFVLPQQFDISFRIITIGAAALTGHFIALSNSKVSSIIFLFIMGTTLLITLYNLKTWTA